MLLRKTRLEATSDVSALAIAVLATSACAIATGADLRIAWAMAAMAIVLALFNYDAIPRRLAAMTLAMSAGALLLLPFSATPFLDIALGLKIGGVIVALMASVSLLVAVARRSQMVRRISAALFERELRAPNASMVAVGHLFPALLNIGGSVLLCEMAELKRGQRTDAGTRSDMAVYTAIHRGFLAASCWSPVFGNLALLLLLYPELEWTDVAPYGFAIGVLFSLVSLAVGPLRPADARLGGTPAGLAMAIAPLVALMLVFLSSSLVLHKILDIPVAIVIVIQTPIYAVLCHLGMSKAAGSAAGQFLRDARQVLPRLAPEAIFFAAGGCMMSLLGNAIPEGMLVAISGIFADGTALAIAFVLGLSLCLAVIGLHPFLTALLIANALPPGTLGLSPLIHFMTVLFGCALAFGASPYTMLSIMISRYADRSPFYLVYRWNGGFLLATLFLGGCLLWALARFLPA